MPLSFSSWGAAVIEISDVILLEKLVEKSAPNAFRADTVLVKEFQYFVRTCLYAFSAGSTFCVVNFWNSGRNINALFCTFFCTKSALKAAGRTVFSDLRFVVAF